MAAPPRRREHLVDVLTSQSVTLTTIHVSMLPLHDQADGTDGRAFAEHLGKSI